MEMRHQPRLAGDQLEQFVVDLDAVERRQAQALQPGLGGEQALAQSAQARPRNSVMSTPVSTISSRRGRARARWRRGSPRTAASGSGRAPARWCRRCSDGRSRSGPRRSCARAAGARRRRSAARSKSRVRTSSTSGMAREARRARAGRRSRWRGFWRRPLAAGAADRLAGLAYRLGGHRAAVDDHPILAGRRALRMASLSAKLRRQPSVIGLDAHANASRSISPLNT